MPLTGLMLRMTTLMRLRAEEGEMVVAEEGRDIEGHTGREVYMCRPGRIGGRSAPGKLRFAFAKLTLFVLARARTVLGT